LGKLLEVPLGISYLDQTYGIAKKTYQNTIGKEIRLKGAESLELPQMEVGLVGKSLN